VCETHGISVVQRNKEEKLAQLKRWLMEVAGDRQELDGMDVSDDDISELSQEDEEMSDGEPLEEDECEAVPDNWETLDDNPGEEDVDGEPCPQWVRKFQENGSRQPQLLQLAMIGYK
ncbi:hypothetical protein Pmar_PMAR013084, partial [Perkinsus marinus ATCC 50983]